MSDEKIILTPEEAESILADGEHIHSYANPAGGLMLGCDHGRLAVIAGFKTAHAIELGGDNCKRMNHALVVWTEPTRLLFFQTDPAKVEALEARKAVPACP